MRAVVEGEPLARSVRWLAGTTGCVTLLIGWLVFASFATVAAGVSFSWEFIAWWGPVFGGPILLAAGSLAAGRWHRVGVLLMLVGAICVTSWVLYFGVPMFISPPPQPNAIVVFTAAATITLVILCDVALGLVALRSWRSRTRGDRARGTRTAAQP